MSAWQTHLTKFRASHPKLSMKECMQQASKSYHSKARSAYRSSKAPPPAPVFKPSELMQPTWSYMVRSYIIDKNNDTVYLLTGSLKRREPQFFVGSMKSFEAKNVNFELANQLQFQDVLKNALISADIVAR